MVKELQGELRALNAELCGQLQQRFEEFTQGCSPLVPAPAVASTTPVEISATDEGEEGEEGEDSEL